MRIVTCEKRDCSWNILSVCISPNLHIIDKDDYAYCDNYTTREIEIDPHDILEQVQGLVEFLRSKGMGNEREK